MGDLHDQALSAFRSAETALQKVSGAAHRGELHRDPKAIGVFLAFSSSAFIGASFVITRKALHRAAARGGKRAGEGGYTYFSEPLWWVGTLTMVVGEIANFSAYAFAPAILVTPLGAISIIISAILAHYYLAERLHVCGDPNPNPNPNPTLPLPFDPRPSPNAHPLTVARARARALPRARAARLLLVRGRLLCARELRP